MSWFEIYGIPIIASVVLTVIFISKLYIAYTIGEKNLKKGKTRRRRRK